MCYLCLKDDPFNAPASQPKRERAADIKRLISEAEEHDLCHVGDVTVERLREEQFRLSKEL